MSSVNVWRSLCWWPGLSDCPVTSSISQGRPQKKPADRNCWDDSEARRRLAEQRCCLEATLDTDWQRSTRYRGAWLCRQLNTMRPSLNATRSGTLSQCSSVCRVVTSHGRTCVYHWPHNTGHCWKHANTCQFFYFTHVSMLDKCLKCVKQYGLFLCHLSPITESSNMLFPQSRTILCRLGWNFS